MKRFFIVSSFIFLFAAIAPSQTDNKLWGGLEIAYGLSLSDKGELHNISYSSGHKMAISSIRGIVGYYFNSNLSIGAGIGFNSYTNPGLNTIPVCLDLRYYPLNFNKNIILNGNVGYVIATSENELKGKILSDFSIGYKIAEIKGITVTPFIGYNYMNYSINFSESTQYRHSIFLKLGIAF